MRADRRNTVTPDIAHIAYLPASAYSRAGCSTTFLGLAVLGNVVLATLAWMSVADILIELKPLVIFAGLLNVASMGFVLAVLAWRKWGVFMDMGPAS